MCVRLCMYAHMFVLALCVRSCVLARAYVCVISAITGKSPKSNTTHCTTTREHTFNHAPFRQDGDGSLGNDFLSINWVNFGPPTVTGQESQMGGPVETLQRGQQISAVVFVNEHHDTFGLREIVQICDKNVELIISC